MSQDPDAEFLRVGTAEREEASRVLGQHFAEGRLTTEEYEDRVARAFAARHRADLRPLFSDLPAPHPALLTEPEVGRPPHGAVPPAPGAGRELVTSERSATVAGILQLVVPFGVGRFYTGHTGLAVAQLLVTLLTLGVGALWPMIDGILLLVNGGVDGNGRPLSR